MLLIVIIMIKRKTSKHITRAYTVPLYSKSISNDE